MDNVVLAKDIKTGDVLFLGGHGRTEHADWKKVTKVKTKKSSVEVSAGGRDYTFPLGSVIRAGGKIGKENTSEGS